MEKTENTDSVITSWMVLSCAVSGPGDRIGARLRHFAQCALAKIAATAAGVR